MPAAVFHKGVNRGSLMPRALRSEKHPSLVNLEAGHNNALIYPILGNCRAHGLNTEDDLEEVVKRLSPHVTEAQAAALKPAAIAPRKKVLCAKARRDESSVRMRRSSGCVKWGGRILRRLSFSGKSQPNMTTRKTDTLGFERCLSAQQRLDIRRGMAGVAEREGFEPSVTFLPRSLSKGVLSTAQPPFRVIALRRALSTIVAGTGQGWVCGK